MFFYFFYFRPNVFEMSVIFVSNQSVTKTDHRPDIYPTVLCLFIHKFIWRDFISWCSDQWGGADQLWKLYPDPQPFYVSTKIVSWKGVVSRIIKNYNSIKQVFFRLAPAYDKTQKQFQTSIIKLNFFLAE